MRMRALGRVTTTRIALLVASIQVGCAGGGELVTTSFSDGTGTGGLGDGSVSMTSADGSVSADTTHGGGTEPMGSTTDPDPSGTTGDDCLAEELCDGLDNTCEGDVDEGCDCEPFATQPCYSGPDGSQGVGACMQGTQACTVDGVWGGCDGEVTPQDEVCDGLDNDCNDEVDEGFETTVCGEGICQVTVDTCEGGVPARCVPGEPDDAESCNGIDDDCDGEIDEGCSCDDGQQQACYAGPRGTQGIGLCVAGQQQCVGGAWGSCDGDVVPAPEVCDGLDNDCDMAADENNPGGGAACGTGLAGVCSVGHQQCLNAAVSCVQDNQPSGEICDGFDNDCDTGVDEGNPGGGTACNTGLAGACSAGTNQCMGGALQCSQNVPASTEVCDDVDNDCDGTNNEGNPGGGQACSTGLPGVCGPGTTSCAGGVATCNANTAPSGEVCDGLDNDCDTGVDEGNPGGGGGCNTGLLGVCANGVSTCNGGAFTCSQTVFASGEVCGNGVDEDCDGVADDGCGCGHSECTTGGALTADCSGCAAEVCSTDAFCCTTSWDQVCVNEASTICAAPMCSSCSHSPCDIGDVLVDGCDAGFANCVATICASDPYCCTTAWDQICVNEVGSVCGITCA